jgi:hypothetical protein
MWKRAGLIALSFIFAIAGLAPASATGAYTITFSSGQTTTWTLADFNINEGATTSSAGGSHGDAYDGAMNLTVCADATCGYTTGTYNTYAGTGTWDGTNQTYTGASAVVSGLTVTAQYRFSTSISAGRMLASFQNTTGSTISRIVRVWSDLGSDGSTYLKYTSSNTTLSNQTMSVEGSSNYWAISSQDSSLTATAQASLDPLCSYIFGTPGANVTPNSSLQNGYNYITYRLDIPANSTQSILFVFGLGEISSPANTFAGALNGVQTYLDGYSKLPLDLVGDLTATQISRIQNWVIAPSPSTFSSTQISPTNTSNPITYSLTMSQSITGLAGADFYNGGTATNCSFTPDTSTGTSFNITISGCGEGTLNPVLAANSVTGSQLGPTVNTPATTTIVIDRTAPRVSTAVPVNGTYSATGTSALNVTVVFSESVTVTGTPRIPITIGTTSRFANYVSMTDSKTATFRFTVTVDYNDIDLDGIAVNSPLDPNSGTIADLATNAMSTFSFTPPSSTTAYVYQPPSAPTIDSITANNTSLTVYFTAGAANGSTVSNYQFSTNNGGSFSVLSPTDAVSPITITGLTNGTTYQIVIKAISNLGVGLASNMVASTPTASASVSISLTASATTANKGTPITITAQVNQAGVITFFWNGERIPGCIKKPATTSATCIWKPSVTGQWSINALLDPTDPTYVDSYSPKLPVFILRRSGTR